MKKGKCARIARIIKSKRIVMQRNSSYDDTTAYYKTAMI
jgi:hypothetical protein